MVARIYFDDGELEIFAMIRGDTDNTIVMFFLNQVLLCPRLSGFHYSGILERLQTVHFKSA